jgi:hypothetical protein
MTDLRPRLRIAGTGARPVGHRPTLGGTVMKRICLFLAATFVASTIESTSIAHAHTAQQCVKELQSYSAMCKFSPTAFILGFCKNKKAQKWCSDRKLHDEKFHK